MKTLLSLMLTIATWSTTAIAQCDPCDPMCANWNPCHSDCSPQPSTCDVVLQTLHDTPVPRPDQCENFLEFDGSEYVLNRHGDSGFDDCYPAIITMKEIANPQRNVVEGVEPHRNGFNDEYQGQACDGFLGSFNPACDSCGNNIGGGASYVWNPGVGIGANAGCATTFVPYHCYAEDVAFGTCSTYFEENIIDDEDYEYMCESGYVDFGAPSLVPGATTLEWFSVILEMSMVAQVDNSNTFGIDGDPRPLDTMGTVYMGHDSEGNFPNPTDNHRYTISSQRAHCRHPDDTEAEAAIASYKRDEGDFYHHVRGVTYVAIQKDVFDALTQSLQTAGHPFGLVTATNEVNDEVEIRWNRKAIGRMTDTFVGAPTHLQHTEKLFDGLTDLYFENSLSIPVAVSRIAPNVRTDLVMHAASQNRVVTLVEPPGPPVTVTSASGKTEEVVILAIDHAPFIPSP